jgi:uncharacterized protein (DUF58 family)
VLLSLGIVRSELAVLLWGAAFVILVVYATIGVLLMRAVVARRIGVEHDEVRLSIEPARVHRGGSATARMSAPLPARRLPGIRLYGTTRLDWSGRTARSSALVDVGSRRVEIPLDTGRRGVYALTGASIVARDLLGFCSAPVPVPASGMLTVLPNAVETPVAATVATAGGEHRVHAAHRRRSEELFETRRYVPGDDPRKINWKLFARWNELLVRIGEEVPPPRSRVLCYLLTGAAPARREAPTMSVVPRRGGRGDAENTLDAAVDTFAGVCRYLARRGIDVTYGFGGVPSRGVTGAERDREFLSELAGADWDGGELPPASRFEGEGGRRPVILVVPEETARTAEAVRRLSTHARVVDTVAARAAAAASDGDVPWWRRLLFREAPVPAGGGHG